MSTSTSTSKGKQPAQAPPSECDSNCSHSHNDIPWPVVRADEIAASQEKQEHFLDPSKGRTTACLSEMVGMFNMGIHKVNLDPHSESTVLHSHLSESEWIYILEGSCTLLLARSHGSTEDLMPAAERRIEYEQVALGAGDFAGFPAGPPNERYAHALRAGEGGVGYLLGGDRREVDVITYPSLGKTLVCHEGTDGEAMFAGRSE